MRGWEKSQHNACGSIIKEIIMQLNKGCVFIDPYNLLLCQWNFIIVFM